MVVKDFGCCCFASLRPSCLLVFRLEGVLLESVPASCECASRKGLDENGFSISDSFYAESFREISDTKSH